MGSLLPTALPDVRTLASQFGRSHGLCTAAYRSHTSAVHKRDPPFFGAVSQSTSSVQLIHAEMVTRLSLAFLVLSTVAFGADVIDQFARQGRALITDAEIKGQQVRQCTCTEQTECVEGMKKQAMDCVETCWEGFNDITDNPKDLRKCFARTDYLFDSFLTCFEQNVDACLAEKSDVMIQKVNISELLRLGVERIEKTKIQLTKTLAAPIRKIVDTAGSFGLCVKECFQKKNAQGFCFDQKRCQPLIMDKKARKSLRRCTKAIDWKKEAGELCDCSVKAGISELSQYCPMLRLMGQRKQKSG